MNNEDFIVTKDLNEVARIHSNPQYANWRIEYIDGEYRFYSPNYKKTEEINLAQQQNQEQIQQLKVQISNYDSQIERLLASMQPYMQIPKVNQELSKVIEKNNEINSSQIIDSLNDYKTVVEIKQSLLSYLQRADKFIKDNVGIAHKPVVNQQPAQLQTSAQSLPDNFWDEFDQPQEKQITTDQSFEEIMDDFKNPNLTTKPERRYNLDGTYTMEYIAHLANTPLGFNKNIYDQLMQENEIKRQQSNEQMTSGGRQM